MNLRRALLDIEPVVKALGDEKIFHSFYLEFGRRLSLLELICEQCPENSVIIDLGASPFIVSCALSRLGYRVVAVDYDPSKYLDVAASCDVEVVRADLERDRLPDLPVDCAVFSEVIEHLNPYYVTHTLSEINRVLKIGGKLVLTTPNIASLFKRIRLFLGIQPQWIIHVHEYTKKEIEELLRRHGFNVLTSQYSDINDLTYVDAEPEEYLELGSYFSLLKHLLRRPTGVNTLRTLAYPLVKLVPGLRMLIVVVAEKTADAKPLTTSRW